MLPSVRTPIFSPGGIPYMFRFHVRENAQQERQAFLGLRARYTLVLFNPATACCIVLIGLLTVAYLLVAQLIKAVKAYVVLECKALALVSSTGGSYYTQTLPVYTTFNLGVQTAVQQYSYSLNASVVNIQSATTDYMQLLAAHYQGMQTSSIWAAYQAAENSTTVLGGWAKSELESAQNYSETLLAAIKNAVGSLGGTTNLTSNISTAVPFDLNDTLVAAFHQPTNTFYNISQNSELQLKAMYANFSSAMSEMLAPLSQGLPQNMSLVPSVYSTDGCSATGTQIDAFLASLRHRYLLQMAFVAVLAVLFVGASAVYIYYRWKALQRAVQEKPSMRGYNRADNLAVTVAAWITQRTKCKSPARVEWICSYAMSSFLIKILVVGWCCIVAGLCLHDMKGSLGALQIDFGSGLPSNTNVTNGTVEVSVAALNSDVENLELALNNNMTAALTVLITNVASIVATVNSTLYNATATTLDSLNTTYPSLEFDLLWQDGVAMQQISLPRVADYNLTAQQHTLDLSSPYTLRNITEVLSKGSKTFHIVGGTLLGMYGLWLFGSLLYAGLVFA